MTKEQIEAIRLHTEDINNLAQQHDEEGVWQHTEAITLICEGLHEMYARHCSGIQSHWQPKFGLGY